MDIIQYILSWIILIFFKLAEASQDDIMILPKAGQESIKRKILQVPREFVTGIRSLADNSYVPLLSVDTISEVQQILEFQNPIPGSFVQAEFYFQTKITQTILAIEVESNGYILKGVVLDKKKSKKSGKQQEDKIIPSPYAEIIEDIHDVIILNLGFMYPGQHMKIIVKYLEELEREASNVLKFTLPIASQLKNERIHDRDLTSIRYLNQQYQDIFKNNNDSQKNIDSKFKDFSYINFSEINSENQNFVTYDWKINGQIFSSEQIESVVSVSHKKELIIQHVKSQENNFLTYFSLDYGKNTQESKDFVLLITEKIVKDQNQSRAFMGYDPQDTLYPYAALIRFSPLISLNPDDSNSSCTDKSKTNNRKSQNQFLNNNQYEPYFSALEESEYYEYEDLEYNSPPKNKPVQQNNSQSCQDLFNSQEQQSQQNQPKKLERQIVVVVEDIINISSNQFSLEEYKFFVKKIVLELIRTLSSYQKRQKINIFLISSEENILPESEDIDFSNTEEFDKIIEKKIQVRRAHEPIKLPIETILQNFQQNSRKQYLLVVGRGDYWNFNQILYNLGLLKRLVFYGIGIGYHNTNQFFQRIQQMNCGKSVILNTFDDINQEINKIMIDVNAPKFKKFTIIYDQKIVSSMSSIIDNLNTISLTKSYSMNVFFNKNLQKLIKQSKKYQTNKITFTLVVLDEENTIYKTKAKIYFDQILKTNVFHKLAANQQIQTYLVNALYKPDGFQNLSLMRQGTTAYERIQHFSVKYQILSEVTTIYLLDSQFLLCSKNLDSSIKVLQQYIIKLQLEQPTEEEEINIFVLLQNLKNKNNSAKESINILLKSESESKNNKKQQIKQKQSNQKTEYTCMLNLNPLSMIYKKMEQFKLINHITDIDNIRIYNEIKNEKGQSYTDLVRSLKDSISTLLDINPKVLAMHLKYTSFLIFTLIFT